MAHQGFAAARALGGTAGTRCLQPHLPSVPLIAAPTGLWVACSQVSEGEEFLAMVQASDPGGGSVVFRLSGDDEVDFTIDSVDGNGVTRPGNG